MTCGVYLIENKKTKQKYVGQSINIEKRWQQHCRGYDKQHSYIDNAIQKHGKNNFIFSIITELPHDKILLNIHEKYWIKFYNSYTNQKHYNLTPGGDYNPSQDLKIAKKISKSLKGIDRSGKKNPMYGKKHTSITKKKMSELKKGISLSQDVKDKMSFNKTTTGYYNVSIEKTKNTKQGFVYCYQYYDDDKKRHKIRSTDLDKLKDKVIAKKLRWYKLTNPTIN